MRQARNQEARELIGSRVGAAKAMFTKHTSEGQLQSKYVSILIGSCLFINRRITFQTEHTTAGEASPEFHCAAY